MHGNDSKKGNKVASKRKKRYDARREGRKSRRPSKEGKRKALSSYPTTSDNQKRKQG